MIVVFRKRRYKLLRRTQYTWTAYNAGNYKALARSSESYNNLADCVMAFEQVAGASVDNVDSGVITDAMTGEEGFAAHTATRTDTPFGRGIEVQWDGFGARS